MSVTKDLAKFLILAVLVGGVGVFLYRNFAPHHPHHRGNSARVNVVVPELSAAALKGKRVFDANCVACHGNNAAGTDQGPPLVHDIYNPGHHADLTFYRAVKLGTRQHHWPYGNMPPQPQVSEDQVAAIVKYVRELQVANGIKYRPHRM